MPALWASHPIVKALQKKFGSQLRFVFRNFPLRKIHPNAETAAETAEFAATHDKFWEMHDFIFENQQDLSQELLSDLAKRLKLDARELVRALGVGEFAERVKKDFSGGVRSGVNRTPTPTIDANVRHPGASPCARCSLRSTQALALSLHVLTTVYGNVGASEECCLLQAQVDDQAGDLARPPTRLV